jgi:hypothetical protein
MPTTTIIIIDILLHQNGHIRLTDFDLSKKSLPPGNPDIVKPSSPRMVSIYIFILTLFDPAHFFFFLSATFY